LGTPQEIADRAVEEFGPDADAGAVQAERAWRVLQGAAVAVALVTGIVVAFILPSYGFSSSDSVTPDGPHTAEPSAGTIFQQLGLAMALVALVPALVAAAPLAVPRRARAATGSVAAAVLTLMALVGGFTLGGFFLPVVLLSWASLIVWVRLRGAGFGGPARITGRTVARAPSALPLAGARGGGAVGISAAGA